MLPHPQTPFPTSSVWSFYTDQVGRSGNEARKSRSSFPEFVLRLLILSPKAKSGMESLHLKLLTVVYMNCRICTIHMYSCTIHVCVLVFYVNDTSPSSSFLLLPPPFSSFLLLPPSSTFLLLPPPSSSFLLPNFHRFCHLRTEWRNPKMPFVWSTLPWLLQ